METFKKEISITAPEFDPDTNTHSWPSVPKTATFKELSRTDKDQHKLHFMLIGIFGANGENMDIDTDKMYDITVKFISLCLVPDESFTESDKTSLLGDSGSLFQFGMWLVKEKILPFFLLLMQK